MRSALFVSCWLLGCVAGPNREAERTAASSQQLVEAIVHTTVRPPN